MIWPLFGTTNQLLAALTPLVISVALLRMGRRTIFTVAPLTFLLVMTVVALLVQLRGFWESAQYFLVGMDLLILAASIWVVLESASASVEAWQGRYAT